MHQAATATSSPVRRKRKSRRKLYIWLGIGGFILLLIIGSAISSKREQPVPITTEKAARRTIIETVSATGKVQPETEVKISPEVAGEIIELPVEDGKRVKKGDLILKIRPDTYKAILEQQQAAISTAESVSGQQKAAMEKAEQDLVQAKDLFQKKLISQTEMLAAQTSYDAAKSMYRIRPAQHRRRAGELEPGAGSAFEDDDLLAARRRDHGAQQQARRARGGDGSVCRHRSDARGRSQPHAGGCGRE